MKLLDFLFHLQRVVKSVIYTNSRISHSFVWRFKLKRWVWNKQNKRLSRSIDFCTNCIKWIISLYDFSFFIYFFLIFTVGSAWLFWCSYLRAPQQSRSFCTHQLDWAWRLRILHHIPGLSREGLGPRRIRQRIMILIKCTVSFNRFCPVKLQFLTCTRGRFSNNEKC